MPLVFSSLSHGDVAFGFFNIESDMLLLNNYFFFASDFCQSVGELAGSKASGPSRSDLEIYLLQDKQIGNLMRAIHGIELQGFIGDVYRMFPFPSEREAFRQNPEGHKTREAIEKAISKYAKPVKVALSVDESGGTMDIGDYMFGREAFQDLLRYVWVGGYPRWKDSARPAYVDKMKALVEKSTHPLFAGLSF
jgi:hypothetical protein